MYRREKMKWIRRIVYLVLVPVLIAAVLFLIAGKGDGKGQSAADGSTGGGAAADAEASGQDKDGDGLADDAAAGGRTGSELFAEPVYTEAIQKISFTAGGESAAQRSVPVQIKASILGGPEEEMIWAVFLPGEMSSHPRIRFSEYDTVTMKALKEGEYYNEGRLDPYSGAAESDAGENAGAAGGGEDGISGEEGSGEDGISGADGSSAGMNQGAEDSQNAAYSETGARTYSSGDEVYGFADGSAFSVNMVDSDDTVHSEVLYVFSCTGTATMYLDTQSGSMENVDSDPTQETSEKARFVVFLPDGSTDSMGECSVRGRGNSTWNMKKRPYSLNLTEKKSVLGMNACRKLCLLANTFDMTNLLDRVSAQIALNLQMRDTPEGEFVNLYLNGQYNGLYYLSQRPRTGGSVNIDKLDDRILEANGLADESWLPERIALHEDEEQRSSRKEEDRDLKRWAYDWKEEPSDYTGAYLLQQYSRYEGEDCWFQTHNRRYRIMSPSYPTVGEVTYISDYMLSAERAIYSEDGIDPESGKHYSEFLDLPSWQDMFMLEEYFVEWDAERWSFYIIKDRKDPLLHCGPMWDFDHSAGTMLYGTYPETAVSTLMFRDNRDGWLQTLLTHDEFVSDLYDRWRERFSPAIHAYLDTELEKEIAAIESAAYMNNIRRVNEVDFLEVTDTLKTWLHRRLEFVDAYVGQDGGDQPSDSADSYCRVLFKFPWGNLSHYVPRGETLGYLPLPEYGETQIPTQIEKNEIIGWQDENGNVISADIVIDSDRTFECVIRQ